MLNEIEHLLTILGEECAEVAQRASKAIRFGLEEKEPGQDATNAERLHVEVDQLMAVLGMLQDRGILPRMENRQVVMDKQARVERYMEYARQCGTLEPEPGINRVPVGQRCDALEPILACLSGGPCNGRQQRVVDDGAEAVCIVNDMAHWYSPTERTGKATCNETGEVLKSRQYVFSETCPVSELVPVGN